MKKLIVILPIFIIVILGLWMFFRGDDKLEPSQPLSGSPFGSDSEVGVPSNIPAGFEGVISNENETVDNLLYRISSDPVSGFVAISRGTTTVIRYVERATGHIFESTMPSEGSAEVKKTRLTNNTIPKVYKAHFRSDGSSVILRTLSEESDFVSNLSVSLTPPRSTSTNALYSVSATSLRGDIGSIIPGQADSIFYALKDNGSIMSSTFSGSNVRNLFVPGFSSWNLSRLGQNLIIYTKPSIFSPGYAYQLNSSGGNINRLVGPLNGLIATGNPSGNKILYSHYENGEIRLYSMSTPSSEVYEITPSALADKCVWANTNQNLFYCGTAIGGIFGAEPDSWYQGKTLFSDYLWKYDLLTDSSDLVTNPKTEFGIDIDVYEPRVSPNDDYLVFINKRDLTLWAVKLK